MKPNLQPHPEVNPTSLALYRRAADYLAAALIHLRRNVLLEAPLTPGDLKSAAAPGTWPLVAGANLVHAHLNRLIIDHGAAVMVVTGPAAAAPATVANAYLDGSLGEVDPALAHGWGGLEALVERFSPASGDGPSIPGVIHRGSTRSCALSRAFGAALDDPELLVACLLGDEEAERAPAIAAWQAARFLDPRTSGAVLPILLLDPARRGQSALYEGMTDEALVAFFGAQGWRARVIRVAQGALADPLSDTRSEALDGAVARALEAAYAEIEAGRRGPPDGAPRWPMLIVRLPAVAAPGVGGEGGAADDGTEVRHLRGCAPGGGGGLLELEAWLRAFEPDELFDDSGRPIGAVLACCPHGPHRIGMRGVADGRGSAVGIALPEFFAHAVQVRQRGTARGHVPSPLGEYLGEVLRAEASRGRTFRVFGPASSVAAILGPPPGAPPEGGGGPVETERRSGSDGREIGEFVGETGGETGGEIGLGAGEGRGAGEGAIATESLDLRSEHLAQGWLEGYTLTGRRGLYVGPEGEAVTIQAMVDEYARFIQESRALTWRKAPPSLTYLLTPETGGPTCDSSCGSRGAAVINAFLDRPAAVTRVYLPPDANTLLSTVDHCLRSRGYLNLIIGVGADAPVWLSAEEAVAHARAGASVWTWAGTAGAARPDVVLAAAGAGVMAEVIAAARRLAQDAPMLRVRVVNVMDLMVLGTPDGHPHGMSDEAFAALFPPNVEVIFAFHGHASAVRQLVFTRPDPQRFHVLGAADAPQPGASVGARALAIAALRRSPRIASLAAELIAQYQAPRAAGHG